MLRLTKSSIFCFQLNACSDTHGELYPGLLKGDTNTAAIRLYSEEAMKQQNLQVSFLSNQLEMG